MAGGSAEARSTSWHAPRPLEGVKSRRKPIFEVASGGWVVGGAAVGPRRVSGLRVALGSRISAAGVGAHIAVELLLGRAEPGCSECEPPAHVPKYAWLTSSRVVRHEQLEVAHLGPHLAGASASEQEHLDAVAAELQRRPQIVVVDEASSACADNWAQVYAQMLDGDAVRNFRGAIVIRSAEETAAAMRLCSERWLGGAGWLWQEVVADDVQIIEDALCVLGGEGGDNCEVHPLFHQVRELSEKVFVMEDSAAKARERGWVLTLLTEEPQPNPDAGDAGQQAQELAESESSAGARRLCGFMCHRMHPTKAEMHIARLAVVEQSRGRGHGRRLMHWALEKAARMPGSECAWISLSSYDEAMHFYEHFGFTDMTCDDHEADEDHFQTWMELQNISAAVGAQEGKLA